MPTRIMSAIDSAGIVGSNGKTLAQNNPGLSQRLRKIRPEMYQEGSIGSQMANQSVHSQITEGSVSPTSMAGMQANLNRRANRGSGTYQNIRT